MVNDKLFHFFQSKFPFNTEGLEDFIASFYQKAYRKETIICQANNQETNLRFLDKGMIREYYAYQDRERNITFYTEPEFITDFNALTQNIPTKKYQECLTDVQISVLSKDKFEDFLQNYPCGKSFIDTIFKKIIAQKAEEEFKSFCLSPDELYLDMLQNQPNWLQQIPQYHLASYLGITPETLSRIRKRITS